jgi:histone chaperone ASF1
LNNPTNFLNPLQFEITFDCTAELSQDIEWKVIYVGSAENSSFDQVLDEIMVGPVPVGINKFILQTDAPDPSLIPQSDLLGITVILVTCSYKDQEFARVGYYVKNEFIPFEGYDPAIDGIEGYPLDLSKVVRTIVADKPRVTRFPIQWEGDSEFLTSDCEMQQDLDIHNYNDENIDMEGGSLTNDASNLSSPEKSHFVQSSNVVSPDWSNHSGVMIEH